MSEPNGRPPPKASRQDLAARPPVCLKPLTVPGPPAAPVDEEGGFLAVCRWMTSASWTHSSVHPSLTARHSLSCSFTPSPPHHSLPLIHTAHRAPPGPPVQTLSQAPPLTPATTVTSVLHRFQPAWHGCHLQVPPLGPGHIFLPRASLSLWGGATRTHVAHTPMQATRAEASVPRRRRSDDGTRKPQGKCSSPGQTVLRHVLQGSQRSLGIKQSVTHSND